MNLTEKEVAALKECLNYSTREAQLDDNYSNGGMAEFINLFGNKHVAAGVVSSLMEKGLGEMDTEDDIFWLTEKGVNAIFDYLEAESAKKEDNGTYEVVIKFSVSAKDVNKQALGFHDNLIHAIHRMVRDCDCGIVYRQSTIRHIEES